MGFKYKDIIKKFGKIALMGVVTLGAVGGTIASTYSRNAFCVSAYEKNGDTYTINNDEIVYMYDDVYFNINTISVTGGKGRYYVDFYINESSFNYYKSQYSKSQSNRYSSIGNFLDSSMSVKIKYVSSSSYSDVSFKKESSSGNMIRLYFDSSVAIESIYISTSVQPTIENGYDPFDKIVITVPASDTTAPALETQVFMTNVDSPMTLDYILSQTKFVDEVDGDLTPVVVTDNYSSNKNKLGKWTIEVKATDKAGNTGTGTIEVWVLDKTAPTINGTSVFTSNMSSPLTLESILSHITVTDNVDSGLTPTVVSNGFTEHEQEKGEKIITLKATDSSGNESAIFTIKVNVVDDIKPTIKGTNSYTTSYKTAIDLSTVEAALTITDNVDTGLTLEKIFDNYTGNKFIPGTYTVSYRTTDKAGNISETFNVTIEVNDKIPPVFYTNGKFIGITQANALSQQDLVNVLIYMEGLYADETAEAQIVSYGGYEVGAVNAPGAYTLSYKVRTAAGESEVKEATIKVLGEKEETPDTDKEEKKENKVGKWFNEKIGDPIKKAWEYCKSNKWTWFTAGGVVIGLFALIVLIANSKERRREERIANRFNRYRGRR